MNALLKESYERVKYLLIENRETVEKIALELLQKETMTAEEVRRIYSQ